MYVFIYSFIYLCLFIFGLFVHLLVCSFIYLLALELLFQALRQYSNILAYTCVSTIFSSRTVIL